MNRGSFLKRAGAVVGALAFGKLPAAAAKTDAEWIDYDVGPPVPVENTVLSRSMIASGGLCAPVAPYYDLVMVDGLKRPIRDSLPSVKTGRGGIRYDDPGRPYTFPESWLDDQEDDE